MRLVESIERVGASKFRRRWAAAPAALWILALASAADAQRLWSVGDVTGRAADVSRWYGVASSAVTVDGLNPPPAQVAEVAVDFDYLRRGTGYLELPLADGSVIEAENAVFEDRGGGNLMWTGEVPDAGYESVLLTVQDGHLVGWFGEPGGPKYVVHAGPDGRGTVTVEQGPTGDWCGVRSPPSAAATAGRVVAPAADRPFSVAAASSVATLDILILHTSRTERYWREELGSVAAGVQQMEDYLNMVFRNGEIPGRANLIGRSWEPEALIAPPVVDGLASAGLHSALTGESLIRKSWIPRSSLPGSFWHWEHRFSKAVESLRSTSEADIVYFIPTVRAEAGGRGFLRSSVEAWDLSYGWGVPAGGYILAHEVGHMLGAWHEPADYSRFAEAQRAAIRPYAFGHVDLTSCAKREGYGETLVCPATTMYSGKGRGRAPIREPFYSSVRHKPNGWTIGVAGTSEVERVFHETVPVAARDSEVARRVEQFPRRVEARWAGRGRIRATWPERWAADARFSVRLALVGGSNLIEGSNRVWDSESDGLEPVLENGQVAGAEIGVGRLRPADAYRISVVGPDRPGSPWIRSAASDVFLLRPNASGAAPAVPALLGVEPVGSNGARLS